MNKLFRSLLFSFALTTSVAYSAGMAPVEVQVSDASGKLAYKGRTGANGFFSTKTMQPGNYIVQFNSKDAAVKGKQFAIVVSAGKQKVTANGVAGEKFSGGGVAMKLKVAQSNSISGQVSTGKIAASSGADDSRVKIINGKRYVWVGPETGSNMGGRWVEEGSPAAQNVRTMSSGDVQSLQERGSEGAPPGR